MVPQVFGKEHLIYIAVSSVIAVGCFVLMNKFARTLFSRTLILKGLALLLLASILANRFSQVFRYEETRWYCIIPDSFCGMTSLVLALSVLFGKKDNPVFHFIWLLAIFGGISTVVYPTFVSQNQSFFYLPTISGLLHHSFSAITAISLLMLKQINISLKRWYCVILGFACYLTVGAFLMSVFELSDAFHIAEPLLPDTPLTAWFMAPIYLAAHGLILVTVDLVKKYKLSVSRGESEKASRAA